MPLDPLLSALALKSEAESSLKDGELEKAWDSMQLAIEKLKEAKANAVGVKIKFMVYNKKDSTKIIIFLIFLANLFIERRDK